VAGGSCSKFRTPIHFRWQGQLVFYVPSVGYREIDWDFVVTFEGIRRPRSDGQFEARANISTRQDTIDAAMVQYLFAEESLGIAGQIVVPRALPDRSGDNPRL
jgi:hypothetical protein